MSDLHCRRCRVVLGQTDGARLVMGAAIMQRSVTLHCGRCGQRRVWVPVKLAVRILVAA